MAKTKWPKIPHYLIPLFQCACIYLCRSKKEWTQAEKSIGVDAVSVEFSSGMCRHIIDDATGENFYMIGVFDGSVSTLVHECAHATFYCCNDVGVTVDTGSANETYCYLLERMFSHFLPHFKRD
ncbi:hypothetical protein N6P31_01240 [Pectobacterium betavasculorum]|uniref:hypothetical protein n=1 Tax=Pectobacterium betavasculorum TaxID=55207 RepID=UPI00313AD59B